MATKADRARLDADRKAKPRTRLVGHARRGDCVGPGSVAADAIEDVGTGARTPLRAGRKLPVGEMTVKKVWLHVTLTDGIDVKAFASLKSGNEVGDYFGNWGPHLPCGLPREFTKLYVRYGSHGGNNVEVFAWGEEDALVDSVEVEPGTGLVVEVDGKELYAQWEEPTEE